MDILFFASLKEKLKTDKYSIDEDNITVLELKKKLGEALQVSYFDDGMLCAVNHEIASDTVIIKATDEVAFYPPVTGG
jgi:molybdopterin converting factor subunit 1